MISTFDDFLEIRKELEDRDYGDGGDGGDVFSDGDMFLKDCLIMVVVLVIVRVVETGEEMVMMTNSYRW